MVYDPGWSILKELDLLEGLVIITFGLQWTNFASGLARLAYFSTVANQIEMQGIEGARVTYILQDFVRFVSRDFWPNQAQPASNTVYVSIDRERRPAEGKQQDDRRRLRPNTLDLG
jgi:hypothetical protein